jgi:hypothetical protein
VRGPKISWQGADRFAREKKAPTSLPMVARPKRLMAMPCRKANANPTCGDLSPEGRARAYLPSTFGAPAFIFSSAISKHSVCPYPTVELLSKPVGVPIGATIADRDYKVLAHDLVTIPRYVGAASAGIMATQMRLLFRFCRSASGSGTQVTFGGLRARRKSRSARGS